MKIATVLFLALWASVVHGQDTELGVVGDPPGEPDKWQILISPYLWVPFSVEGDSTVSGTTASLDLDLDDVLDLNEWGASGRVEAWRNDWGIIADGGYVSLSGDQRIPLTKIDIDIDDGFFDLLVGRRLDLSELFEEGEVRPLFFEVHAGGRYHYLKQKVTLKPGPSLGKSKDWLEPVVGARILYQMTDKLSLLARGDFGGFGVGSASDLTLNALGGFAYSVTSNVDLGLGYKVQDIDYSNGSGTDEFGWDATLHGPYLAVGITF